MHETLTAQRWMNPFAPDALQPALDGGNTHAKSFGKLTDRLLLLQISIPQDILAHLHSTTELVAAILTLIQLYAPAYTILLRVRTSAHKTSHFEHSNIALVAPLMAAKLVAERDSDHFQPAK